MIVQPVFPQEQESLAAIVPRWRTRRVEDGGGVQRWQISSLSMPKLGQNPSLLSQGPVFVGSTQVKANTFPKQSRTQLHELCTSTLAERIEATPDYEG